MMSYRKVFSAVNVFFFYTSGLTVYEHFSDLIAR